MSHQTRRWCFTGFPTTQSNLCENSSQTDISNWCQKVASIMKTSVDITYFCFQPELTSASPRKLHLQGVAFLKKKKTMVGFKRVLETLLILLPDPLLAPPHLESMKATWGEAVAYCQDPAKRVPEQDYWEDGTPPANGTRTDLDDVHTLIMDGVSEYDLIRNQCSFNVWAKYHRALARAIELRRDERVRRLSYTIPCVKIYYGATGSGKSRQAYKEACEADTDLFPVEFNNGGSSNWFPPGLPAEPWLLFDDFYGGLSWHALLRICDGYGTSVQSKGESTRIRPGRIYFTSNQHPDLWYKPESVPDKGPLWRRVHQGGGEIRYFSSEGYDHSSVHMVCSAPWSVMPLPLQL